MSVFPVGNPDRPWGADCPVHRPVPEPDRCAASDCDSVPLAALAEDERARVTCLDEADVGALRKLAAMGVLPGAEVTLIQRSPVFVFRLGYAEFAVDAELAARVRVRRENGTTS